MTGTRSDMPDDAPRDSLRYRIVVALVLVVAAGLFTAAVMTAQTDTADDQVAQSGETGRIVERLIPERDEQVVRQAAIGVDLAAGWTGTLVVDGREVPADELTERPDLFQITFTPGEGKVVEELTAGTNCVAAIVWRLATGRGSSDRTVRWCFEVL